MPLAVGQTFADYTIVRLLGAGGMGEVYLAKHPRLPRKDALKLLGGNVSADRSFRERFLREADLTSTLDHPNIVGVHDRGEYHGQLWISMDFIDGADAGELLAQRYPAGMPKDLVAEIVTAVASALDYAHRKGLLHRDVKPANILLAEVDDPEERRILLTDFGIARTLDEVSGLTGTNMTVGTVGYTAPEQLMGLAVDGRADQYALAATAYHLFTGFPLFPATNAAVLINHHLNTQPPALGTTRPGLSALDRVLAAALTKDPAYRFASCGEFARTLAAQVPKQPNPYMHASTTTRDVDNYVMPAVPPASGGGHLPPPLPPAPYLNVSAPPGPPVWNRPGWQAPPTRRGRGVPPAVQWAIGIVAILAIIGSAWFVVSRYTAGSSDKAGTTDVTTTESTFETTTDTTTSTRTTTPRRLVTVTVVDTCDEGGSCGVRQRSAPRKTAPNLVPDLLTDGTSVAAVCRTTGDVMSSEGHGSSSVWYRLKNGAYVNVVYFNLEGTDDPPSC